MTARVYEHPVLGRLPESETMRFTFNGESYSAVKGDTIASALLANGVRQLREHEESGTGRGIYCNIGHCFECRVRVNGDQVVRACMTPVRENLEVCSQRKG